VKRALAVVGLCAVAFADDGGATARHLAAGVKAFQDGRFDDALVEFRVVQRASDAPADLAFYLGPTLVKLGRDREAIAVFVASTAPRDALTDFYLGEAYYHERMYRKARATFAALRATGLGPVLDDAAARYVARVDEAFQRAPEPATVDHYIAQARAAPDPILSAELYDEARLVDDLATVHPRRGELRAALAAAWIVTGRASHAIALLDADPARTPDGTWQLARAYAAVHDTARARPLLASLVAARGRHASDAAALLATLP
jgi:thioredoxin-like negative regulator of GroEL